VNRCGQWTVLGAICPCVWDVLSYLPLRGAALKMLTMCMAAEWAQYNINVNPSTGLRRGSGQGLGHCAVGLGVPQTYGFSQPLWGNPDLAERIVSANS
jgi:hypothetical protein